MLVEADKRRADALPEAPVVLGDGQEWFLPKVRVRWAPGPEGIHQRLVVPGLPGFQGLVDRIAAAIDLPEDAPNRVTAYFQAEMDVAVALVRRNYDLTDDELAEVLAWSIDEADDPQGYAVREDVLAVARGEGPKAGSDTDG